MKENTKKKITYFAGSSLVVLAIAGAGIGIIEKLVDHTEQICPITKICQNIEVDDTHSLGDIHQINAMESDYRNQGKKIEVSFDPNFYDTRTMRVLYQTKSNNIMLTRNVKKYVGPVYIANVDGEEIVLKLK